MPRVVVRKGYRCLPGKRRELLAALQRVDAVASEAGWPRGRYLFVETKVPGEPDLEVEFSFESYAEMERLERQMREHVVRSASGIGSAGQEFLLEPSSTRYLLLLDEAAAAGGRGPRTSQAAPAVGGQVAAASSAGRGSARSDQGRPAPATVPATVPAAGSSAAEPLEPEDELGDEEEDGPDELYTPPPPEEEPGLTPAERRLRQLAQARAALDGAETTVNVSEERRTRARQLTQRTERSDE